MKYFLLLFCAGLLSVAGIFGGVWFLKNNYNVPQEAVIAFDAGKGCPEGWSEYKPAQGAFIIGYQEKEPVSRDESDLLKLDIGQEELEVGKSGSFAIGTVTDPGGISDRSVINPDPPLASINSIPAVALRFCQNTL